MSRKRKNRGSTTGTIRHRDETARTTGTPTADDGVTTTGDQGATTTESPQVKGVTTGDQDDTATPTGSTGSTPPADDDGRPVFTAADAARRCGVARSTLMRRLHAGEIPGAAKDDDGAWRVPLAGLLAAGLVPDAHRPPADADDDPAPVLDAAARIAAAEHAAAIARLEGELLAERARREAAETLAAERAARVADLQNALRMIEPPRATPETAPESPDTADQAPADHQDTPTGSTRPRGMGARLRSWWTGTP